MEEHDDETTLERKQRQVWLLITIGILLTVAFFVVVIGGFNCATNPCVLQPIPILFAVILVGACAAMFTEFLRLSA